MSDGNPFYVPQEVLDKAKTDLRLEHLARQTKAIAQRKDERYLKRLSAKDREIVMAARAIKAWTSESKIGGGLSAFGSGDNKDNSGPTVDLTLCDGSVVRVNGIVISGPT